MACHGYAERMNRRRAREHPEAHSAAMKELAEQGRFAGSWDQTPIDTAMSHIGMLLTAGEDAMRTFATAIVAERTPVFSFIPLARAGLENLALAHWLSEPGIGAKERIRRSLNERLASAYEQKRLPKALNPEPGRVARLHEATSLDLDLTRSRKGSPRWFAPGRPSITQNIKRVLDDNNAGSTIYSYASAVSHGYLWGLTQGAVPTEEPKANDVVTAAIVISSERIAIFASALAMAHHRTYSGYLSHMGWSAPKWEAAWVDAMQVIARHLLRDGVTQPPATNWDVGRQPDLWLPPGLPAV